MDTVMNADLNIVEILNETGEVNFRYSRYLSSDGSHWVRHGVFFAYHKNGNLASEGSYEHGVEHGLWKDYHESGAIAAQGRFENGKELCDWEYWDEYGNKEGK
jgi:antitoxin component YwqK of YwqJK toxin-antitoxin module